MGNTMVGTSLVDLSYIFGVSEEKISRAPLILAVGYVTGAMLAGQVTRWITNRQLIMAAFLIPMALVNFAILHVTYGLMFVLLFFYGAGFGSCDTLLSVWIVELWPFHNSVILPLSVVLFGFGQVVAPVMMSPFVYGDLPENSTEIVTPQERINSLMVPYTICGVFQIIIPTLYVIFNFTSFKYESPKDKNNNKVDDIDADFSSIKTDPRIANNPARKWHLCIAGVAVAAYGGCEQGWNAFGPTMYQHFQGKDFIDASEASLLFAYFSIAFSGGLLITTFIAMKLTPDTIIFYQLALIFISLVMMFLGYTNKPVIYVSTILLGYGMAPLWAMKYAFVGEFSYSIIGLFHVSNLTFYHSPSIERHLMLTDRVTSTYTIMFGSAAILVPLILEQTAKQNPRVLLIIMAGFMVLSAISFFTVKTWLIAIQKQYNSLKALAGV